MFFLGLITGVVLMVAVGLLFLYWALRSIDRSDRQRLRSIDRNDRKR